MTRLCFALAFIAAGLAIAAFAGEPTQKDIEAMQGTWTIESFTSDGQDVPQETIQRWRRIVAGDRVTWKQNEDILVELRIKFDPAKKPMTLDSTIDSGDAKGQTLLAIYELNGDELRVCFTAPDQSRPTEFSAAQGSGQLMYTAKRVKP